MEALEYSKLSLRDFFHVIFKRKNQILLFFIVSTCLITAVTLAIKPTYEAKIQVLVKVGRENVYVPASSNSIPIINVNYDNQINSEIELLKNRSLVENVMNNLAPKSIYKDLDHTKAVLKFQKSLSIKRIKDSNMIEISYKHKDPKLAATVVNAFANAYLDQHLLVHKNPQSYEFFEEQSRILKTKLKQSEERLKSFKKQHNVTNVEEEQRILLERISELRVELDRTLTEQIETKTQIGPLNSQEERLVELELKEKELLGKYKPESRLVQNVRDEIKMVQKKIFSRNQAGQITLSAKKETQKAQLAYYQNKLDKLNRIKEKLDQLQMEIDVNRQNYRLYLTRFEESRISDAMDNKKISNISLVEPASPPLKPISPTVLLNILIAIFLGGFGGLGLAFFNEYVDDSLEKPDDVEKVLRLPVLASIPELELKG